VNRKSKIDLMEQQKVGKLCLVLDLDNTMVKSNVIQTKSVVNKLEENKFNIRLISPHQETNYCVTKRPGQL
jgi:predicted HAD superfamily phosphohydrolase YqeG